MVKVRSTNGEPLLHSSTLCGGAWDAVSFGHGPLVRSRQCCERQAGALQPALLGNGTMASGTRAALAQLKGPMVASG